MQVTVDLLKHARTALERSASVLSELSLMLKRSATGTGRAHRIMVEETVAELDRLHAVLTGCYSDMVLAPREELPERFREREKKSGRRPLEETAFRGEFKS